jgi:hypothetical protein
MKILTSKQYYKAVDILTKKLKDDPKATARLLRLIEAISQYEREKSAR